LLSIEPVGNEKECFVASTTKPFVEKLPEALLTIELVCDEKESLVALATESFVEERLLPADSSLHATVEPQTMLVWPFWWTLAFKNTLL
jgi:hypothetical protein